jgi:Flp pilus assembly protein TadD
LQAARIQRVNSPLGLTFYHRRQQLSVTGEAIRPMSKPMFRSRLRRFAAVSLACLALSACQMRGGPGDVTGSIGSAASQPRGPEQWRAEEAQWAARYEANAKDRNAAFYYARALRALDKNAQALAILQGAVLVHTKDLELLGAYGRSLADNGRLKEADDVLSRAHTPEKPDWRVLSAQGTVADQLGEHERAQQIYQTALRLAPNEPTIMSNLGLSLALTKRLPEAERVLREAVAAPGSDARVRQNLVLVLGLQGRFAEAEQLARQDMSPAEATATVAYLRRSVSQPNSWEMLRGGKAKPQRAG